jgi:hypothetical protein
VIADNRPHEAHCDEVQGKGACDCDPRSGFALDAAGCLVITAAVADDCEVCNGARADWQAAIGGGGAVAACTQCVECDAAVLPRSGVTWYRLDGLVRMTDGLPVIVERASAVSR